MYYTKLCYCRNSLLHGVAHQIIETSRETTKYIKLRGQYCLKLFVKLMTIIGGMEKICISIGVSVGLICRECAMLYKVYISLGDLRIGKFLIKVVPPNFVFDINLEYLYRVDSNVDLHSSCRENALK